MADAYKIINNSVTGVDNYVTSLINTDLANASKIFNSGLSFIDKKYSTIDNYLSFGTETIGHFNKMLSLTARSKLADEKRLLSSGFQMKVESGQGISDKDIENFSTEYNSLINSYSTFLSNDELHSELGNLTKEVTAIKSSIVKKDATQSLLSILSPHHLVTTKEDYKRAITLSKDDSVKQSAYAIMGGAGYYNNRIAQETALLGKLITNVEGDNKTPGIIEELYSSGHVSEEVKDYYLNAYNISHAVYGEDKAIERGVYPNQVNIMTPMYGRIISSNGGVSLSSLIGHQSPDNVLIKKTVSDIMRDLVVNRDFQKFDNFVFSSGVQSKSSLTRMAYGYFDLETDTVYISEEAQKVSDGLIDEQIKTFKSFDSTRTSRETTQFASQILNTLETHLINPILNSFNPLNALSKRSRIFVGAARISNESSDYLLRTVYENKDLYKESRESDYFANVLNNQEIINAQMAKSIHKGELSRIGLTGDANLAISNASQDSIRWTVNEYKNTGFLNPSDLEKLRGVFTKVTDSLPNLQDIKNNSIGGTLSYTDMRELLSIAAANGNYHNNISMVVDGKAGTVLLGFKNDATIPVLANKLNNISFSKHFDLRTEEGVKELSDFIIKLSEK